MASYSKPYLFERQCLVVPALFVKSAAVSQHDSIAALTIEIGSDLPPIISCKGDGLLCRRHDGESQGEEKNVMCQLARL